MKNKSNKNHSQYSHTHEKSKHVYNKNSTTTNGSLYGNLIIQKERVLNMINKGKELLDILTNPEIGAGMLNEYKPLFANTQKFIQEGKIKEGFSKSQVSRFCSSKMLHTMYEYVNQHEDYKDKWDDFLQSINHTYGKIPNHQRQESVLSNKYNKNHISINPAGGIYDSTYRIKPVNGVAGKGVKY